MERDVLKLPQGFAPGFVSLLQRLRQDYPAELFHLEGIADEQLDINAVSRAFFRTGTDTAADCSIDPNANVTGRDVITFNYEVPKSIMKLNSLHNLWKTADEMFGTDTADAIIKAELLGLIYIHDAWDIGRPYCFNYSTLDIALNGLKLSARLDITPPRSLATFLRQVEQFMVYAANSTLGATGMADLLIVASWYVDRIMDYEESRYYYDNHVCVGTSRKEAWRYVKENLTSLIYTMNWEFRGNQSPFSNVSIYDGPFLDVMLPGYLIAGKCPRKETVMTVQEVFLDCYNETLSRNPITFPVITACLSLAPDEGERKIADREFLAMICRQNLRYGFINFYTGKTSTLSSCCRLRSSMSDLGYANSFGSGSTRIGSLGVCTINLPALARAAVEKNGTSPKALTDFCKDAASFAGLAATVNQVKREFIRDRIARGSLPLYTQGFMDISRQYSTCGFTGLYEALEILGQDIRKPQGLQAAKRILGAINAANSLMESCFCAPHNMEQVPGETAAVKLAAKDTARQDNPEGCLFYSNQFLPLWDAKSDLLDRIRVQGELDSYCTGGAVCHLNLGEPLADASVMEALAEHAVSAGVIYFAVNYVINRCVNQHVTAGSTRENCPICNDRITDTFTRVVGFLTNTKKWNRTRREADWPGRVFYGTDTETEKDK